MPENATTEALAESPRSAVWWLQASILGILIVVLYYGIVIRLAGQWTSDPNYSHGFIVPLFCAWVLWKDRERIAKIPAKPNWFGLVIILGGLGLLVLGVLGAENFLSRTSLLFVAAGIAVQFRGWRFFRAILFPWAVLFLAIPIPVLIFNKIAFPLQFFASKLASGLLALFGVPVLREGNVIYLPSLTLDVVEACSGLRSLVSLITLAVFYGYLFERRNLLRVLVILSAIPIAVIANGFRIMGSGMLGEYWNPDKAEGFFHLFSGWLIFVVSLCLLFLFHSLLQWISRRMARRPA